MLAAAWTGFLVQGSLILAIGAQNAFVLRQGLLGAHVAPVVLFCAVSDAILIFAGVAGFGALTAALPWLPDAMTLAGAAFVAAYGVQRGLAAWRGGQAVAGGGEAGSLGAALGTMAALTWLNPHVYLDTLALMGAISTGFEGAARWTFAAGGTLASGLFFAALGFGARGLAPVMRSPGAWRVLDGIVAATMLTIAAGLFLSL